MDNIKRILLKITQNICFNVPNDENYTYYAFIGKTLIRVSNHCSLLHKWDNFLERHPDFERTPMVSIVFEDNDNTFNENECLILKRYKETPLKVQEYVYSVDNLTEEDVDNIILSLKTINGTYIDTTDKSVIYERVSKNPTITAEKDK